jgi:hypothetical protein
LIIDTARLVSRRNGHVRQGSEDHDHCEEHDLQGKVLGHHHCLIEMGIQGSKMELQSSLSKGSHENQKQIKKIIDFQCSLGNKGNDDCGRETGGWNWQRIDESRQIMTRVGVRGPDLSLDFGKHIS